MANAHSDISVHSAQDNARLQAQLAAGALIVDSGRRRPFYFDGRFLTADDLTADQNYIRARQSDLAQAIGAGAHQEPEHGQAGSMAQGSELCGGAIRFHISSSLHLLQTDLCFECQAPFVFPDIF